MRKPFSEQDANEVINISNAFDFTNGEAARAIQYIRYSDHNQDEGMSIEYQKDTCEKFIDSKGWVLTDTFIDAAKSGKKTANRENFMKMMNSAKRGDFDVVVVYKFSRIFRNAYEAHLYEHELAKYGVKIISATEPIDGDSIEGKMMKGIIHIFNEFTSGTIAAHVTSSMVTVAQKGLWTGGITPFGYKAAYIDAERPEDGKKYAIDENEATVIRFIYDMWANGFTQAQIQQACLDKGFKTRKGNPVNSSTISQIIRNDAYIGTYRYKAKGFDEVVIENCHPPIIDKETWNLVQYRLQNPTTSFPKPKMKGKRIYPLSGKIVCSYCDYRFIGQTKGRKSKTSETVKDHSYYVCAGKKHKRVCKCRDIRKDNLEEYVFRKIKEHILNEEAIKNIANEVFKITGNTAGVRSDVVNEYKAKQKELTELIANAFDQQFKTRNATAQAIMDQKIDEYSRELESVNEQIAKYNLVDEAALTTQKIIDYLNELLEYVESGDPALLKIVADNLVEKIIASDEDIEVILNVHINKYIRHNEQIGLPSWRLCLTLKAETLRNIGINQFSFK